MKRCEVTNKLISTFNRRCTGAGRFYTSSAGARASLILLSIVGGSIIGAGIIGFLQKNQVAAATYSLGVSYSGAQSIDVIPGNASDPAGTGVTIAEDEITVTTTCRAGYNFAVGTSVNNNNLYLDGDSSANTAGTYFTPSDGVAALNNSPNTWGYYYNVSNTPTASSVFSPVPASGTAADVLITPTASATDITDNFSVYYGVAVSNSVVPGTYKMIPDTNNSNADGTIVYYATMAEACVAYTVSYNPTSTASGSSVSGTGTMASQTIYEGIATNLTTNGFTAPTGYEFAGWNTSQDGTGTAYANGASVTDLTTSGNAVTLYAQWVKVVGDIRYDGNGADEGEMANQQASANTSVMLRAYNYKRSGYGFLGWSTVKNPTIGTDTIYGPMEHITTPSTMATTGLNLYAVWIPADTTDTMQSFTATKCANRLSQIKYDSTNSTFYTDGQSTITSASFIALKDTRDNDTYMVARLSDGNCWMLENLRLNENAANINTNALSQNGASFTVSSLPVSTNSFGTRYTTIQYNKNNTDINNDNLTASYSGNNNAVKWYGYGNYYSWAAARGTTSALSSGNTTTSICPANWQMPIGNNSTENYSFGKLSTSMGGASATMDWSSTPTGAVISARLRQFPNNFVYSGYWDSAYSLRRSSYGYYWSSKANSSYNAYNLNFRSNVVYPGTDYNSKYVGHSVRCVASGS